MNGMKETLHVFCFVFFLIFLLSFLPHSITERFEVPKMSRLNVLLDVLV